VTELPETEPPSVPAPPPEDGAGEASPSAEAPQSYEAAIARLDAIIARLDSGQAELRETLGLVREGKTLVEFCKGELDAVSGELEKLDLDKLVEQLDSAGASE
jgi:exodeoxyribonuclease VII small subunit